MTDTQTIVLRTYNGRDVLLRALTYKYEDVDGPYFCRITRLLETGTTIEETKANLDAMSKGLTEAVFELDYEIGTEQQYYNNENPDPIAVVTGWLPVTHQDEKDRVKEAILNEIAAKARVKEEMRLVRERQEASVARALAETKENAKETIEALIEQFPDLAGLLKD